MSTAAWVMLCTVVLVLGGGFAVCLGIAIGVDRRKRQEGVGFHDEEG